MSNPIPNEVVLEFIGSIRFSKYEETDVQMAENVANNPYNSLDDLIDHCRAITMAMTPKAFEQEVNLCKTNPFFAKHLKINQKDN